MLFRGESHHCGDPPALRALTCGWSESAEMRALVVAPNRETGGVTPPQPSPVREQHQG